MPHNNTPTTLEHQMNYFVVSRSHESLQSDEFGSQKLGGRKCGGSDSNAEGMLRSGHKGACGKTCGVWNGWVIPL